MNSVSADVLACTNRLESLPRRWSAGINCAIRSQQEPEHWLDRCGTTKTAYSFLCLVMRQGRLVWDLDRLVSG